MKNSQIIPFKSCLPVSNSKTCSKQPVSNQLATKSKAGDLTVDEITLYNDHGKPELSNYIKGVLSQLEHYLKCSEITPLAPLDRGES